MVRDKTRGLLTNNGLALEQAQQRVDALTDYEAQLLAEKIDKLPIGGTLTALLIIYLEFIILELAGVTGIFIVISP